MKEVRKRLEKEQQFKEMNLSFHDDTDKQPLFVKVPVRG